LADQVSKSTKIMKWLMIVLGVVTIGFGIISFLDTPPTDEPAPVVQQQSTNKAKGNSPF